MRAWFAKRTVRTGAALAAVVVAAAPLAACGSNDDSGKAKAGGKVTLRLGYFLNVTHAPALYGTSQGTFASALGPDVKIDSKVFNAGPEEVTALLSDSLDIGFIGPNPAINAYVQNKAGVRVIAGATSGGAALVVKPEIKAPADLKGKKISSPQAGNTQDVALRWYLKDQGYKSDLSGGGDVHVISTDNAGVQTAFTNGSIDGAWVPEPYVSRLVKAGGHVLVNEKDLWPGGQFVTTLVVVRTKFLKDHPDVVKNFLTGEVNTINALSQPDAKAKTGEALDKATGKPLAPGVLDAAWSDLSFTPDPLAASLRTSADHAQQLGLLKPVDLGGLFDLTSLNSVLTSQGKPAVTS